MRIWATAMLVLAAAAAPPALASNYHVLHDFCAKTNCADGSHPVAQLAIDGAGTLYGTTGLGGAHGAGTVFEIVRGEGGTSYRRLYSFDNCQGCANGTNPQTPVMLDAKGAIYGTAYNGGVRNVGTLFRLAPDEKEHWHAHVSHAFCSSPYCSDGSNPISGMSYPGARYGAPYDDSAEAYGVTIAGGLNNYGVLYRWTPKGGEYIAKSFCQEQNCADGAQPNGEIAFNDAGYACGTTRSGGTGQQGTLFCLDEGDGFWSYSFCSLGECADGAAPQSGVTPDGNGNLLGTARLGGANGQGVLYSLSIATHGQRVLYSFCSRANCADGQNPSSGVLLIGGTLFGTTSRGGKYGGGTIYRIDAKGREKVLHSFCRVDGCPDGYAPTASLITDGNGHLFGTTPQGGRHGGGTVFELDL